MTRKEVKKIVLASYRGNNLDKKRVQRIAKFLSRKDLKTYISLLKLHEMKKTVIISLSVKNIKQLNKFYKLYPDKKIIIQHDPSLLAGISVMNNDLLYQFNLKNSLEILKAEITE